MEKMVEGIGLIETGCIQVEVVVRLGNVFLTVEDLSLLQPGGLIDLDREMSDGVDICVGEQVVAKGELTMVEDGGDRIGIRIIGSTRISR